MSFDKALEIVTRVCVEYRGTLSEHQLIQQALKVLRDSKETVQASVSESKEVGTPTS
jgi:hypothetical protein